MPGPSHAVTGTCRTMSATQCAAAMNGAISRSSIAIAFMVLGSWSEKHPDHGTAGKDGTAGTVNPVVCRAAALRQPSIDCAYTQDYALHVALRRVGRCARPTDADG